MSSPAVDLGRAVRRLFTKALDRFAGAKVTLLRRPAGNVAVQVQPVGWAVPARHRRPRQPGVLRVPRHLVAAAPARPDGLDLPPTTRTGAQR